MDYIDVDDDTRNLKIIEDLMATLAGMGQKVVLDIRYNFDIPGYPRPVYKIFVIGKRKISQHVNVYVDCTRELAQSSEKSDVIITLNGLIKNTQLTNKGE